MRKKRNPLGVILMIIGMLVTMYFGLETRNKATLISDNMVGSGMQTTGEIISFQDNDGNLIPVVRFYVEGSPYTAQGGFEVEPGSGYEIGMILKVAYDPAQPATRNYLFQLDQENKLRSDEYTGNIIGAILMFLGFALLF